MRDPDLVQRAERAANALEQAWMRWRVQHGLGSGPQPPVSSYVGYSLEEPWGQARVVLGVAAEEAERFAAVLEGHDCVGPMPAGVSAGRERGHSAEAEAGAPGWTTLDSSLALAAAPPASPQHDRAPSVPAQYVPAQAGRGQAGREQPGREQSGDVLAADGLVAEPRADADAEAAAHMGDDWAESAGSLEAAGLAGPAGSPELAGPPERAGSVKPGRLPEPAGLPESAASSYRAPEFTVATDDPAAVQPSLPAALGRAAAVADMPAELPQAAAAHLQELAALPPGSPAMSQTSAPPATAGDRTSIGSSAAPPAASKPGVVTIRPRSAAPHEARSERSQPAAPDRQQGRADQLQEHGDDAATSSHRSPNSGTRTRLLPASKLNRQRRPVADHDAPSWQSGASQGPQAATDTVV